MKIRTRSRGEDLIGIIGLGLIAAAILLLLFATSLSRKPHAPLPVRSKNAVPSQTDGDTAPLPGKPAVPRRGI